MRLRSHWPSRAFMFMDIRRRSALAPAPVPRAFAWLACWFSCWLAAWYVLWLICR
jgi:hypothetical protein